MAKDKAQEQKTADSAAYVRSSDTVGDSTFESPVRRVENVGSVDEEKAKELNGYKGHDNIASQVEESQEARGRKRDTKTETGAKYF